MSMDTNAPRAMSAPSSEITPFDAICHTASPAQMRIEADVRIVMAECFTAERAASSSLSTGYDFTAKTWEVIVQYQGDISFLEQEGVRITYLFFQYAILTLPEQLVDYVTKLPQITYMEMPKRLFFADFA